MTEPSSEPSEHTLEELAEHVIKAIAEVKEIPEDTINLDSTFEGLEVDSLDAMEMLFLMEEKLDMNMPDTAVRAMRNVRQVERARHAGRSLEALGQVDQVTSCRLVRAR